MPLAAQRPKLRALNDERRRRHQRVKVNLLGRYMLPDRREFPCQVVNMSPGGMALIVPVSGQPGDRIIRLCRSSGPARSRQDRTHGCLRTASRYDDLGDGPQTRQTRRAAHLARQSQYSRSAGRSPARPYRAAQSDGPWLILPERRQPDLPHHRRVGIRAPVSRLDQNGRRWGRW